MPRFNGITITEGGQALLAKAQIGKNLNFTKMQLGSNNDTSSPETKTAVIAPFLTTAITELKLTGDGKARISTYISNQSLQQSYVWREIGLFALDPDTNEEILYAYKCAGENGETLPAGGGADIIEKIFDIIINISNATNITATIDGSSVYIKTRDIITEFEDCENESTKVPSAKLFYDTINSILNAALPIGITLEFADNEDHSNHCGFVWRRDNEGVFPVGYKSRRC
ncbi:MAG: phage tail protein [Clostridia bacterium]|nr:phage tail protein [Clostridia bacterium]